MRIFAPNDVSAKSRFWYFMKKLRKLKKTVGEVVSCEEVGKKHSIKRVDATRALDIRREKSENQKLRYLAALRLALGNA